MKQAAPKETQKQKFLATARELGSNDNETAFNKALRHIGFAKIAAPRKSKVKKPA